MKITEEQVDYVAALADLAFSREEALRMAHDLSGILDHIATLNELDTADIEPMTQVLYEAEATATLREDKPRPVLGSELAVANAPVSGAGYFKVPKVIER